MALHSVLSIAALLVRFSFSDANNHPSKNFRRK